MVCHLDLWDFCPQSSRRPSWNKAFSPSPLFCFSVVCVWEGQSPVTLQVLPSVTGLSRRSKASIQGLSQAPGELADGNEFQDAEKWRVMQVSVGLALSGRGLASPSRCTSLESAVGHPWLFPSFQVPLLLLFRMCDEEDKALTLSQWPSLLQLCQL